MRLFAFLLLLASVPGLLGAQTSVSKTLNVYPGAVPAALGHADADRPTIDVHLPASNPTHTAVLVIPGGAYSKVVADREGAGPADWLLPRGVAAVVPPYRRAPPPYPSP